MKAILPLMYFENMINTEILHYKIERKLGEGGMGIVYLARDTKLDRLVAIKFLPRSIAVNGQDRQQFQTEASQRCATEKILTYFLT